MMNDELLFFCAECRKKSEEEISEIKCTIEHRVKSYKRGEYIAYQNDKVTHLFMLTKGKVKTQIASDSGLTLFLEDISAPYPLASAFLFANSNKFPVDIVATEKCEVILISKESVERQMMKCQGFLRGFMTYNANRMQYIAERLKIFAQRGIKAKIGYYILSKEMRGEFQFDRSISSLAEYFGIERPSLSRAISEMVKDGIISFKAREGKILNQKALQDIL